MLTFMTIRMENLQEKMNELEAQNRRLAQRNLELERQVQENKELKQALVKSSVGISFRMPVLRSLGHCEFSQLFALRACPDVWS